MKDKISKNYTNRKADLSLFDSSIENTSYPFMGIRNNGPFAVAGPLKVANQFIKIFLSYTNERKEHGENFGTDVLMLASTGQLRYPIQIEQVISAETLKVIDFIKENTLPETPLDERIEKIELLEHSTQPGGILNISMKLTVRSGDETVFLIPVKWN